MRKTRTVFMAMMIFTLAGAFSFAEVYKDNNTSQNDGANVFFYRLAGNKNIVAVPKIGQRVAGAVLPNSYAKTKVCMGTLDVGVAQRGNIIRTTNSLPSLDVKSPENIYFRINEMSDGKFTLSKVDSSTGSKEIKSAGLKSKVINRNVPNCKVPVSQNK